ncbi:MAG: sugar transferase [Candidatus Paceibacterota bacterium]
MSFKSARDAFILAIGDVVILYVALWLTLFVRYGRVPDTEILDAHLIPFSVLFIAWLIVFYIAGLYERPILALKVNVSSLIFETQIVNSIISLAFFYFIPLFSISPKTNLVIFLFVSLVLFIAWRNASYWILRSREPTPAFLIASGEEMKELKEEVNSDARRRINFVSSVNLDKMEGVDTQRDIVGTIYSEGVRIIVVDLHHKNTEDLLPHLYNLIFSNIRFVDMQRLYEDFFHRVPLSVLHYNWFLENISSAPKNSYEALKRVMDVFLGLVFGLVSLIFYPFLALFIYLEDKGPIFFSQQRVGKKSIPFNLYKFRTMTPDGDRTTKIGKILRSSHLDELPQLWSVVKGDLSLVGPRPEVNDLVRSYEKVVPYYNIRHLIKPGLTGWAQLYSIDPPKFNPSAEKTAQKLSYDLYYIKNRSVFLDIQVFLKTVKHLVLNKGK